MPQVILQSEDYLLQSRSFQEQIDIVVKSIANITVNSVDRVTVYGDLTDAINALRDMDTELWDFINAAAAQTFPVYTTAEALSRGPFLSNTDSTIAGEMLQQMADNLQPLLDAYTDYTATPFINSEDITSTNTIFDADANANYQAAYTDFLTVMADAITLIPTLTTI